MAPECTAQKCLWLIQTPQKTQTTSSVNANNESAQPFRDYFIVELFPERLHHILSRHEITRHFMKSKFKENSRNGKVWTTEKHTRIGKKYIRIPNFERDTRISREKLGHVI